MSRTRFIQAALVAVVFGFASNCDAQAPSLGYVFPPAIERGKTTEVALGGYDLTPDLQFFVHNDRVKLETDGVPGFFIVPPRPYWEGPRIFSGALALPREIPATLSSPSDLPPGVIKWQAANANGGTAMACFFVSDITEVTEQRFRFESMELGNLPIGVSGRLARLTEKDSYTYTAQQSGPVTIDLWCRRLGTSINIAVQVEDGDGNELINEVDTEGRDITTSFQTTKGSTYSIHIHEADFRGAAQFVYRMALHAGIPASVAADDELTLTENQSSYTSQLQLEAGKQYRIRALSQAIGADLDLQLQLLDVEGKVLAENDDIAATTVDAQLLYTAQEGIAVTAKVTGFPVTGPTYDNRFKLISEEVTRGVKVSAPQTVVGVLGEKATINLTLAATGGFKEEISLAVSGLPEGVTVEGEPKIAAGQAKGAITLNIDPGAKVQASLIQITGKSTGDTEKGLAPIDITVTAPQSGSLVVNNPDTDVTNDILFTIMMKPPFKLELIDKNRQRVVHRGTTYPAPFVLTRDDGYTGVVRLMMAAKQSRHRMGITAPILEVANGTTDILYPCFMPEWLTTDRTTRMVVYGYGEVTDPKGNIRHVGINSDARITMIMEGAHLKLSHQADEIEVTSGESFDIPVKILRSSVLQTPVDIDLEIDGPVTELIRSDPVTLSVDQSQATIHIHTTADSRLKGIIPVTIRAKTLQDGKWLVKSIIDVDIEFK